MSGHASLGVSLSKPRLSTIQRVMQSGAVREMLRVFSTLGMLLAAVAVLGACERKAPRPTECLSFALNWHQVSAAELQAHELPPQLEASLQQVTLRCLTEPFSRKSVDCVARFGPAPACLAPRSVNQPR